MTPSGDPVLGVECPKCGEEAVVYNGTYYCDSCPWGMSEDGPEYGIVEKYLKQRLIAAQEKGNDEEIARMSFHLINGGYV